MNSCYNKCCFWETCQNPGTYPINMARSHKVCEFHYQSIWTHPSLVCAYCKVTCKIAMNLIKPLIENKCKSCSTIIDQKSDLCKKCENFKKFSLLVCENCELMSESVSKKSCEHNLCSKCTREKHCVKCESKSYNQPGFNPVSEPKILPPSKLYQKCGNCSKSATVGTRNCSHPFCDFCRTTDCSICKKNKANTQSSSPVHTGISGNFVQQCKNCSQYGVKTSRNCGHEACLNCLNNHACVFCNYSCTNCKKLGKFVNFSECNHPGCDKCILSGCNLCRNKNLCPECKTRKICNVFQTCDHFLCFECQKKCSICFARCSRCNTSKLKKQHFTKSSDYCDTCLNYSVNRRTCRDCGSENCLNMDRCFPRLNQSFDYNKKVCGKCGSQHEIIPLEPCNHLLCSNCMKLTNGTCFECKEKYDRNLQRCQDCQMELKYLELPCKHFVCDGCFNRTKRCKECNAQYFFNRNYCNNCKNVKENLRIDNCGHLTCKYCFQLLKTCQICARFHDICKFCLRGKANTYNQCGHNSCDSCSRNRSCYDCLVNRIEESNENFCCECCKNFSRKNVKLRCNHNICHKCYAYDFKKLDYCCINCALKHSGNQECITCGDLANFRQDKSGILEKTCCMIYICMRCSKTVGPGIHECKSEYGFIKTIIHIVKEIL